MPTREAVAEQFRFASDELFQDSGLYRTVSRRIVDESWLLHVARRAMRRAVDIVRDGPHAVRHVDATRQLVDVCRRTRSETLLCIGQSFLVSQLAPWARRALDAQLVRLSRARRMVRISAEWVASGTELSVEHWVSGRRSDRCRLARSHPHGSTVFWCA